MKDNNITNLTIDWQKKSETNTVREIQYSTISDNGILTPYNIYHEQRGSNKPKISTAFQTLQVYSAKQLKEMLQKNGFKVIHQCNADGSKFSQSKSDRILTVCRKVEN